LWDDVLLPPSNEYTERYDVTHLNNAPPLFTSQPSVLFYESACGALQCFVKDHVAGGLDNILGARKSVLADMECLAGSEAQSTGMLGNLAKLNVLGHLEHLAKTLVDTSTLASLLSFWGLNECTGTESLERLLLNDAMILDAARQIKGQSIHLIHTELSVKEISLKLLNHKLSPEEGMISKALTSHIYKSCSVYRELGQPDMARAALSSLRSLLQVFQSTGLTDLSSGKLPLILRLEDARIMQSEGNLDDAVMTCKTVANYLTNASGNSTDIDLDMICADSLLLGGLWMAESNVDSVEMIFSSYFEKAAQLANEVRKKERSNSNIHRSAMSSFELGEFAANLYNSVLSRVSSEAWRRRRITAKERKLELKAAAARLSELHKKSRANNDDVTDAKILHATLSREVNIDDRELQCIDNSIQRYLRVSFESICTALALAPTTMTGVPKHVFQLVSIWFKNCNRKETKDIVNGLLKSNLHQIPSYRLVPLTYQLFSRIDTGTVEDGSNGFQDTLREVVVKICSEHPYHGIVQLLALSNGQRIGGGVNGRHANAYLENVGTAKVDAVNSIIQDLRKRAPDYVNALIDSYQALMISYINLAEFDTSTIQKRITKRLSFKQFKLDLDCCLSRSPSLTNTPAIVTKPPPIRPDKQYGNGIDDPIGTERILRFESTFDLTPTGIHRPKIVECIGSKGGRFKQLVKGEDDLRQDAIMQQVFGTVNDLLKHESYSIGTTRQLRLITYGITPLSPASGVLEWVDNTMCFGDFLMDKGKKVGAHSKYFPGGTREFDISSLTNCCNIIMLILSCIKSGGTKTREMFLEVPATQRMPL
jgi:ataxia telangiectasia mutated family protein